MNPELTTLRSQLEVLPFEIAAAGRQMTLDLLWMEQVPPRGALYRHYEWLTPTATFGYFQQWEAVRKQLPADWTLQRRPTGGGIVLHPGGFTYTLIVSGTHPWYRQPAAELYRELHQGIVDTFTATGVESELCQNCSCAEDHVARCQEQPALYDVLWKTNGAKLAGAAMKRNRHGLLFQGHLWTGHLPDFDPERFNTIFTHQLAHILNLELANPLSIQSPRWTTKQELEQLAELTSPEWQTRR